MKKATILLIVSLVILSIAVPQIVTADSSQTWRLDSDDVMYKAPTVVGGQIGINAGTFHIWIADEVATTDVTFPSGNWTGELKFSPAPVADKITVEMGDSTDGSDFAPSTPGDDAIIGDGANTTLSFLVHTENFTVPEGQYLAIKIKNTHGSDSYDLVMDSAASYTSSPAADPGYPVPELSTIILLGSGLAGLGGYFIWRRRKKSYQRA